MAKSILRIVLALIVIAGGTWSLGAPLASGAGDGAGAALITLAQGQAPRAPICVAAKAARSAAASPVRTCLAKGAIRLAECVCYNVCRKRIAGVCVERSRICTGCGGAVRG